MSLSPFLANPAANFIHYHCHSRSYLPLPCLFISAVGHCCQCCWLQRLLGFALACAWSQTCSSLAAGGVALERVTLPGLGSSAPPGCSSPCCSSLQLWGPAQPLVGTRGVTSGQWLLESLMSSSWLFQGRQEGLAESPRALWLLQQALLREGGCSAADTSTGS